MESSKEKKIVIVVMLLLSNAKSAVMPKLANFTVGLIVLTSQVLVVKVANYKKEVQSVERKKTNTATFRNIVMGTKKSVPRTFLSEMESPVSQKVVVC